MNIVYNASAGTGKTYQVTLLYEQLVLEEGIDPRRILLMTFTDNAAGELRMRVAHRLLKARRTAEADGNDELAERAIEAMSRLPAAPIGTIHSFCTRLLREHALEAGLSPRFSTLTGDDRDELLNQICRTELLDRLGTDPAFKTYCSGAHIIGSGGGFGTSITETVPKLLDAAGSLGISLESAESILPDPQAAGSLPGFTLVLDRLRELPKLTADAQKVFQCMEENLPKVGSAEELAQILQAAGLKKFGRGKGQKPISDDFWNLLNAIGDAIKYRKRFPEAKAFARYVQAVALQFRQRKHAMDTIDFDDQLRMAKELLESEKAAPGFDYVIVDEVQDTSRIQCNLIQSLWDENTHLVICGDKKQSIYTWRGADPQVMPDLAARISEQRNLQTSYRSKAPILDVLNPLFELVYGKEEYSEDSAHLKPNPEFETPGEKPCVEFLAPDDDSPEMEAVANRIHLLVNGSNDWKPAFRYSENGFQPMGENNAYRYSDILILLRRTKHQSALEQALRHADIPYTLGGKGRGLFARQETRDVSLFLNVLANPQDALSLVGFLRSPWVGLSDETIAKLAWSEEGFSVGRLLENHSQKTDIVERYREKIGTHLASELVRMLIDETGFDALQAGLPRGPQRLANLRKVLDWLRETERDTHTTTAAVARKLAQQIKNPPPIPEATLLDPAQNAVTIMTVHGSKGLTKRVVVLPDTSFRDNSDRSFARIFFDEKNVPTLGIKITAPDKSSVASPGFKAANTRAKSVREHESKNLFYVAMTRARDLVVTSATVGKKPDGWRKQMEPLIQNGAIESIPYSTLRTGDIHVAPPPHPVRATWMSPLPPPAPPPLQRIPATKLAKEIAIAPRTGGIDAAPTAPEMGTLGHAVLEQLALNDWQGSAAEWLENLRNDFGIEKPGAASLEKRIEATRTLMAKLTADMPEIRPEFPFVLHEGDRLIDGTIDLLCRTADGFAIFDYKFSEADDSAVAEAYRGQMGIYRQAAHRAFPGAGTSAITLVVVSAKGPRMVPMRF